MGRRPAHQEGVGAGGKGSLFGGGQKIPIYYEKGLHVLSTPMMDELRVIQQNGRVLFRGPITRNSHPSGSSFDLGKEGTFTIWWGEGDHLVPITVTPTDTTTDGFFGIESRWPLWTRIVWDQKRLGSSAVWPQMDYTASGTAVQ